MKVLIVEPGKYPREADIEHTLEAEQAVVGGTIEAVYPWRDSACIVCNDNGIAENLPLNRMLGDYDIIHGTFFVCGLTRDDFTDLTPQQMKRYEELYHDPQLFFLLHQFLPDIHCPVSSLLQILQNCCLQGRPHLHHSVQRSHPPH